MKHLEENIQIACVRWFEYQYPQFRLLLHHSPNGGFRNAREAARFKAMGTRAGFADLLLLVPRGGYHGLAIEMKTEEKSSKQSTAQKAWQKAVEEQGYKYQVCRGFDDFMELTNGYISS